MKKLYICALFALVTLAATAQEKIGAYSLSIFPEWEMSVEASQPKDYVFDYYIQVPGKSIDDKVYFNFKSDKTGEMYDALSQCKAKFVEWKKTAIENGVTDMFKDFGISFPRVTVAWLGSKWFFAFGQKISCKFMAGESGYSAVIAGEATASSNQYISTKYYLILKTPEDFDALLAFLDNGVVYEYFNHKQSVDDLFK